MQAELVRLVYRANSFCFTDPASVRVMETLELLRIVLLQRIFEHERLARCNSPEDGFVFAPIILFVLFVKPGQVGQAKTRLRQASATLGDAGIGEAGKAAA